MRCERVKWPAVLALAAAVAGLLLAANAARLTGDLILFDDLAADVLLTEGAPPLVGHYSRFGFNHPGPFFFLPRWLAAQALADVLPSAFNAHVLAVLLMNAGWITGTAVLLARAVNGGWASMAAAAAVMLAWPGGAVLASAWMPNVLVLPLLFTLAVLLRIAQGEMRLLPLAAAAAGALVHGYAPLPPFLAAGGVAALAHGAWRAGRLPLRPLLWALAVAAAFAAPLAVEALLHPPGNLARLLAVAGGSATSHPPAEALAFVLWLWLHGQPVVAALVVLPGLPAALRAVEAAGSLRPLLLLLTVETLVMVLYATRAPGELYGYIGRFYLAVPLLGLTVLAALAGRYYDRRLAAAAAVALVALFAQPSTRDTLMPGLRRMSWAVAADGGGPVALRFGHLDYFGDRFGYHSGLLVDLGRFGIDACIDAPDYAFLFTPGRLCRDPRPVRYAIVPRRSCGGLCLVEVEDIGLRRVADWPRPDAERWTAALLRAAAR